MMRSLKIVVPSLLMCFTGIMVTHPANAQRLEASDFVAPLQYTSDATASPSDFSESTTASVSVPLLLLGGTLGWAVGTIAGVWIGYQLQPPLGESMFPISAGIVAGFITGSILGSTLGVYAANKRDGPFWLMIGSSLLIEAVAIAGWAALAPTEAFVWGDALVLAVAPMAQIGVNIALVRR